MQKPHIGIKVIEERIAAFKELIGIKQPEPRVSVTAPHISVSKVQKSEHTEPRVSASEKAFPSESFAQAFPEMTTAFKHLQKTSTKPTPPIQTTPIATRTQAAQASAKLKAAAHEVANQGPASNTRSKSCNTLERAMYAACFIDNKNGDAQRLASCRYPMAMFAAALALMDMESGNMMKHRQLTNHLDHAIHRTWNTLTANEVGCLLQGVGNRIPKPTNTCHFIRKDQVPSDRFKDVTYGKFECTVRTEKAEKHRTRLVIGRNNIKNSGDVGTPTAETLLVKIMLNSVISTPGAQFMSIDISNFYPKQTGLG